MLCDLRLSNCVSPSALYLTHARGIFAGEIYLPNIAPTNVHIDVHVFVTTLRGRQTDRRGCSFAAGKREREIKIIEQVDRPLIDRHDGATSRSSLQRSRIRFPTMNDDKMSSVTRRRVRGNLFTSVCERRDRCVIISDTRGLGNASFLALGQRCTSISGAR